jgi:putative ABC transport system permease protein
MLAFREASGLAAELDMFDYFSSVLVIIFLTAMSIVLWNAGLTGSLRRYGEMGLRMALGEDKGHIYRSLIAESLMIGIIGSALGTVLGLAVSYHLQIKGVNIASMVKNSTVLLPGVVRARVTTSAFYIGFVPGLLATLLGTSISGIGIYKRQTAQLTKEMET